MSVQIYHVISLLLEEFDPEQQERSREETPVIEEEEQERNPRPVQEEPEPPHIKEEQEEILQRPEEADGTTLTSQDVNTILTAMDALSRQMVEFQESVRKSFQRLDERIERLLVIKGIGASSSAEKSTDSTLPTKRITRAKNSKLAVSDIFLHTGVVCLSLIKAVFMI